MAPQQKDDAFTRTTLDGGVASDIAIVREPDGREIVVKQALPKLRVMADWHSDPARSTLEVEALRVAADLLGGEAVPQILWVDAQNHRFAMERIDPSYENWRAQLARGRVDLDTAVQAAEWLARLHTRSALRPHLAERFVNRAFFEQLRVTPFLLRSAERNPDVATAIGQAIQVLRAPGTALVHGDYSPKNILARGPQIVVLDWEVAHWGDPRFDVAFCLSHLLLGGARFSTATRDFREACVAFSGTYLDRGPVARDDSFLITLTGCLVLARLDGDSPVDYLSDLDVPRVRRFALQLIGQPEMGLPAAIDQLLC